MTFSDLALSDRLRIKRTPIRAIIIKRQGNSYIKYELFKRLNTGGSLLSPQEIRNCSSRMIEGGEEFYHNIQSLAKFDPFRTAIGRLPETAQEERGDEELVLRFLAVKNYIHGYHGNVQEWLDSYMEGVLFSKIEFDTEQEISLFNAVFTLIAEKFGQDAFARHREGQPQGRLAPAYFEAVVGGLLPNLEKVQHKPPKNLRDGLGSLFESTDFRKVTGPGANSIEKLKERISLVSYFFSS